MNVIDTIAIGRPITRGPLSLYPLYAPGRSAVPTYVPGPVAARRGVLQIDEVDGGNVPTLNVLNSGDAPVLLVEGETFEGGLQNRVINVSVLVANGRTQVPVSCVEAHRWSEGDSMRLSDRRAPRRLRRVKNRTVQQALQREGSRFSDQAAVWNAVDATLHDRNVDSETAALHRAFDALDASILAGDGDTVASAVAQLSEFGPLPEQVGVVVAAGGRCIAADLFDSTETLTAYWNQILTSYALDLPTTTAKPPSIDRALRFVRRSLRAGHSTCRGVGIGVEHHWNNERSVAGGLEWHDELVHVSVLAG